MSLPRCELGEPITLTENWFDFADLASSTRLLEDYGQEDLTLLEAFPRIWGFHRLGQAGALVPEKIAFINDGMFRRWIDNGQAFSEGDREWLQLWASYLIAELNYQKAPGMREEGLMVRRAFYIPGEGPAIGSLHFHGITDPQMAVACVHKIFEEGVSLAQERDIPLEEVQVGAFFQRYVEEEVVNLDVIYDEEFRGPLPMSFHGQTIKADPLSGDVWVRVYAGYGNSNHLLSGGCDTYVIRVDGQGKVYPVMEELEERAKLEMRVVTTRSQGDRANFPSGEETVEVPRHLQNVPTMSMEEVSQVARVLWMLYHLSPGENGHGTPFRIEGQSGTNLTGEKRYYFTEAIPQEVTEDVWETVEVEGQVVTVDRESEWDRVVEQLDRGEHVLIYLPSRVVTEKDDVLLEYILGCIQDLAEDDPNILDRIGLLHPSATGTAHQINRLLQIRADLRTQFKKEFKFVSVGSRQIVDGAYYRVDKNGLAVNMVREVDLEHQVVMDMREVGDLNPESAGGKARFLALICRQLNLEMPHGGLLPAEVFQAVLEENDLRELFTELMEADELQEALGLAKKIREGLEKMVFEEQIADDLNRIFSNGVSSFAVRSCALAEDGFVDSFAGLFHTSLNVRRKDVISAIMKVYRSLLGSKVIAHLYANYDKETRKDIFEKLLMAVEIQEYVNVEQKKGSRSLVVFTRDQIHGAFMKVDVAAGPASKIVDGEAGEDLLMHRQTGDIYIRRIVAGQEEMEKVNKTKKKQLLPMKLVGLLQDLRKEIIPQVERFFGRKPVDIELLYIPGRGLVYLQFRPHSV